MISFLVNLVVALFSVFPGMVVVSELFKWRISDAKSVILGVLFWDFLFVSLSIVVGCTSNGLNYFFYSFTAVSGLITILWVLKKLVHRGSFGKLRFALSPHELPLVSLIVILLLYVALAMAFHPMFVEYDAAYDYLPFAKGLSAAGGFYHNPFVASDLQLTEMPLMPIYYAWGISVFGAESFRLVPFTLIVLVVFVIYKISQELFPDKKVISLMAPAIFLTLPAILEAASFYSFYKDLPIMAFTAASVYCSIMAFRYNEAKWYLFAGLSVALAVLSKEGGYIAFILSVGIVSLQFSRKIRLLGLLVAAFPFYFFIIRSTIVYSPGSSLFLVSVVYKQIPVVALLVLYALVLFFVSKGNRSFNRDSLTKVFYFLAPSSVVLFFVLRNYFVFGTPTFLAAFTANTLGLGAAPSLFSFLRFDLLFDSTALGNIYLVLVIVGFVCLVKTLVSKRNLEMAILGIWLVFLLMDWSFFYNFNYFGSEIRRLYLLTPLISIIIAVGFFYLFNRFSKQYAKKDFGFFFAWLFCFLVLICVSVFQLKFVKLAGTYLSYILIPMADELFTLPTFLASLLIPLLVVFLVYLVNKVAGFGKLSINGKLVTFSHRRRVLVSVAALVVIVSVSLVPLNVVQLFGDANSSHWDSGEYAKKALVPAWENSMSEVIDYYNSSLPDNYVTVSFGWETDALVYFANRSVINIGEGVGGYSFLVSNDTEGLLNSLYQSNIRYFLIPNENAVYSATATYSQYMVVSSRILLFRLIPDRDYFFSVKNFTCFSLYKLAVPSGN